MYSFDYGQVKDDVNKNISRDRFGSYNLVCVEVFSLFKLAIHVFEPHNFEQFDSECLFSCVVGKISYFHLSKPEPKK